APKPAPAPELAGERRIAAVIFADIVGSTPMSEALDPEEFREVMNQCFHALTEPIIRYDGTIDKFIGDCIMALFGAPHAHENDAERAVRAALEMQQVALRLEEIVKVQIPEPIRLRVGINCGLVIAGEVGSQSKRDYTAMGRVVNVAERMQKLCEPGSVMVSESVYNATRQLFEFEDAGKHPVKGVAHDVSVYRVLSVGSRGATTRGLQEIGFTAYVNRREELESLRKAVERALSGNATVVAIKGPAGIGKTRLISECQRQMEADGIRWFWARSLEYQRNVPYAPVADLFSQILGLSHDSKTVTEEAVQEALGAIPPSEGECPVLTGLSFIVHGGTHEAEFQGLHGEEIQNCIYRAAECAIEVLLSRAPVAIVIDDLQWCDRASLDLFSYLMRRFSASKLIFCTSYRLYSPPEWDGLANAQEINVGRLSERDMQRLVYLILDKADDYKALTEVRNLILSKCEGNALFVEEMIKLLMDKGLLLREDERWKVTGRPDEAQLPDSLRGMVMARTDQLENTEKLILQTLSVLGSDVSLEVLTELVSGLDKDVTRVGISQLMDHQILSEKQSENGPTYSFSRAFFRDAIYDSLLKSSRRSLHSRAAQHLENSLNLDDRTRPAILAYHCERAGDFEKAYSHTREAARQVALIYANKDAIDLFERCIALLKKSAGEPNTHEILDVMNNLAHVYYLTGNLKRSIEVLEGQIELALSTSDELFVARTHNNIGLLHEHEGNWDTARGHFRQAADIAWRIGDKPLTGQCLTNLGLLQMRVSSLKGAMKSFQDALQIAASVESKHLKFDSLINLAIVNLYRCSLDEAWNLGQQAREMAISGQDDYNLAWSLRVLGEVDLHRGKLRDALASFERYLELATKMETSELQSAAYRFLADTKAIFMPTRDVMSMLRPALCRAARDSHREQKLEALGSLLRLYVQGGRFTPASKISHQITQEAEQFGHNHLIITSLLDRCEWALAVGETCDADEHLAKVEPLLESSGWLLHKPRYLLLVARTARLSGRGEEDLSPAEESIEFCKANGLQIMLAKSHLEKALVHFDRAEYMLCEEACNAGLDVCRLFDIPGNGSDSRVRSTPEESLLILIGQCHHELRKEALPEKMRTGLTDISKHATSAVKSAKSLCVLGVIDGSDELMDLALECIRPVFGNSRTEETRHGILQGLDLSWCIRHIALDLRRRGLSERLNDITGLVEI
ncbi:MAG: AAA family ATPase, partial [Candidatus Coatesbacteria bacterium]|nr:AAA family ATPase [Candidatus Coatesbacteria bacterium]